MRKAILTPAIINLAAYLFLFAPKFFEKDGMGRGLYLITWVPIMLFVVVALQLFLPILFYFFHDREIERKKRLINLLVYYVIAFVPILLFIFGVRP